MTRSPSVKTLSAVFRDPQEAKRVFRMGRKELANTPAGAKRVAMCGSALRTWDVRMTVLDALAETHGVESAETTKGEYATYLNAGDTYAPTVIYWRGRYRVQTLGDFIETAERNRIARFP